jgi:hypothetical protein
MDGGVWAVSGIGRFSVGFGGRVGRSVDSDGWWCRSAGCGCVGGRAIWHAVVVTARRVVIVVTCVVVAGLGVVLALIAWDRLNRIATVVSVLAAVAAIGVGVWAGLPAAGRGGARVTSGGMATADGDGSTANSGVTGPASLGAEVVVDGSGDAKATGGGSANSGVQLS